jgi:hypothetical protein
MHKIVQYPFRAATTQQITTSLKPISLPMPHLGSPLFRIVSIFHLFSQTSARRAFEVATVNEPTSKTGKYDSRFAKNST